MIFMDTVVGRACPPIFSAAWLPTIGCYILVFCLFYLVALFRGASPPDYGVLSGSFWHLQ